jgi:acyl-CoA reductase-like NAD-dependent aldehyde dehydrogenase
MQAETPPTAKFSLVRVSIIQVCYSGVETTMGELTMSGRTSIDIEDLFEKLRQAVAEWEYSPYYVEEEELFDLERFLLDHHAHEFKLELERTYGKPLNQQFWTSSLAYRRLKHAREEVKALDAAQESRRQEYARSVEENNQALQKWLKDLSSSQRRAQFRVIPGRKEDAE